MEKEQEQFELIQPPQDGISSLKFNKYFSQQFSKLATSSWDKNIRVYDIHLNKCLCKMALESPLLDLAWDPHHEKTVWAAGLSGTIYKVNWEESKIIQVIKEAHDSAVKCLLSDFKKGMIISGSWDRTVKIWSLDGILLHTTGLSDKVYAMDISSSSILAVATSARQIYFYSLVSDDNSAQMIYSCDSSLKYTLRVLKFHPMQECFTTGSMEGRISVDYVSSELQSKKYAFKCHRITNEQGIETIYPINCIAFHPKHGTFASGGSDGFVMIWDLVAKKKLKSFPKFESSISALDIDFNGDFIAIAVSYCYEEGEKDHPFDSIIIRKIADEFKAKP